MTPERLRECLAVLRWTQRGAAEQLGVQEKRIRLWLAGTGHVPDEQAEWIERLTRFRERNPPPLKPASGASAPAGAF